MADSEGKAALVTGGGRRIGRTISLALAEAGYAVAVNYERSGDAAEETVRRIVEHGGAAAALRADVSRAEEVRSLVQQAVERFGRLHLLVNNAAVYAPSSFAELNEEVWDRHLDVNLKGTYLCSKEVGDRMLAWGGGRMVNLACLGGFQPWHRHIAYSVSKAGVVMLTRCLARALAPTVRVNAVAPGTVFVPDDEGPAELHPPPERIPLGRYAAPEEIAQAVLFLADGTEYVTGQVLRVDGGISLQSIW